MMPGTIAWTGAEWRPYRCVPCGSPIHPARPPRSSSFRPIVATVTCIFMTAATGRDMTERLARRVEPLGWHVQIHLRSDQIVDAADLLQRLPGTVVFDHLGRLAGGVNDPAFTIIRRMLDRGRTWVKLSGAY